jgi:hypothetical protein
VRAGAAGNAPAKEGDTRLYAAQPAARCGGSGDEGEYPGDGSEIMDCVSWGGVMLSGRQAESNQMAARLGRRLPTALQIGSRRQSLAGREERGRGIPGRDGRVPDREGR